MNIKNAFSKHITTYLSAAGALATVFELVRHLQIELLPKELALSIGTAAIAVAAGAFSVYVASWIKRLRIAPRVFLSYSSEDKDVASKVADALRSDGAYVWLDAEQLKPGQDFRAAIEKAIKESNSFIILLPREAGPYLSYEVGVAQANNVPVISALREGTVTSSAFPGSVQVQLRADEPGGFRKLIEAATHPNLTDSEPASAQG